MGVCLMPDFYETTTAVVKYAEVRKENEEKVKTKMFNWEDVGIEFNRAIDIRF